jgi:hypothetical protein
LSQRGRVCLWRNVKVTMAQQASHRVNLVTVWDQLLVFSPDDC